jgi:branched-chain amino acid transport system substrate-binding protein
MILFSLFNKKPFARHIFFAVLVSVSLGLLKAQAQTGGVDAGLKAEPIQLALIEGLSGPFGNTGEVVYRNLLWAVERVNDRGGVKTVDGKQRLQVVRYDSKGQIEEALSMLNLAIENGSRVVLQGNSSAVAFALVDALNKHNDRNPQKATLLLNYAAVDPALTQERCSFWHFRFDAHAQMRMQALMAVVGKDAALGKVYLIGQDYSFGQSVLKEARAQLKQQRPDISVVGEELHPMGRVKDFLPYAVKIKASGAQAVITGNFGNDLSLLIKAAKDAGFKGKFYTFYGNALGAPAAIGEVGVGQVIAVADWMPNVPGKPSLQFYQAFKQRFPQPEDDYAHLRMHLMVEALAKAIESSGGIQAIPLALALEKSKLQLWGQDAFMRASDHQWQQPLVVGVMDKQGQAGVPFDVEGSGWGFRIIHQMSPLQAEMPANCLMKRPL